VDLRRFAFLALVPAIPLVQGRIDRSLGEFRAQEEVLYVWSGERVRKFCSGLEALCADIYWLRTVQYFGGQLAFKPDRRFELLYPLIDITTTVDPRFEMPYKYGAIFLSEPWPVGKGDPDAGIAILEKGVRALPSAWRLRQYLGYFVFIFKNDSQKASEILLEAAEVPGAAPWLRTFAASLLMKGGERRASRAIWRQMYEESEGALKQNALWHLQYLDTLDMVDALNGVVQRFRSETGRLPASIEELVRPGFLRQRPLDPSGLPFAYDRATGTVSVAKESRFYRRRV
jgi:hypothetical protein